MNTTTLARPTTGTVAKKPPFHATLPATIAKIKGFEGFNLIGDQIVTTFIPKGAQAIKDAWLAKMNDLGVNDDSHGVLAKLDADIATEAAAAKPTDDGTGAGVSS